MKTYKAWYRETVYYEAIIESPSKKDAIHTLNGDPSLFTKVDYVVYDDDELEIEEIENENL
jgi:hypothetical protein